MKIPNLLSLYRLLLSFVIPSLWIKGVSFEVIFILILTGVLSDTLDGNLARLLKQRTSLGKILDPLADKVFINMLFFLFYWMGRIEASFFAVIIMRDIFILLGAIYLFKKGLTIRHISPSILGKTSTVFQLLTLVVLFVDVYLKELPSYLIKAILNSTIFFTAASGFHYFLIFRKLSQYHFSP
ncbi:MAG: CDP-alcohol phosphatidyltransferase family protein [Caldimicrobium sp.]|nr:CDP-alcohol phosphatidyltransferase family protein [Caldimicrobium sp.]MDW8181995.1 CDP-alcohol phosphatidyltransferase family protein [Caldimicrobium sp.]